MARVIITAGVAVASSAAHAAVWNINGQSSVYAGYDDNVRLSVTDLPSSTYAGADAAVHLALDNQAWSWSVDPRSVLMRYQNYPVLNRTENYLASSLQRQTATSSSALSLNWTQDTTLTSELGHTAFAEANKRHQSTALSIQHTQQWTERVDTQTQLYVTSNHYMQAQNTGLVNYNYGSATLAVNHALTTRSQLSLNGSVGKLQVPGKSAYGKINQSIMLSYNASFAERWRGNFSVGPSQVRSDFSHESGTVYDCNLTRKSEISSIQFKYSRDITPAGQGVLTRRQQLTLSASRALSERFTISLSGSRIKNDSLLLSNDLNFDGIRYNQIDVGLSWRWTPTWTVAVNAGHDTQSSENSRGTAKRNYMSLSLAWAGLPHSLH